jgi:hypothetical protein
MVRFGMFLTPRGVKVFKILEALAGGLFFVLFVLACIIQL